MTDPASRAASYPAPRPTSPEVWSGRVDGDGPEHRRWHQCVDSAGSGDSPDSPGVHADVALVGFASDEGVRRNKGRVGAAHAPDAARSALAPLAVHGDLAVHDAGTVEVVDGDLEAAQAALGQAVADLLDSHRVVIVLGGGHEAAWGSYLGRASSARLRDARVGVLNLDAHFDLREAVQPTSGTPFLQMARADETRGADFRYHVVGISEASNTATLFDTANRLGATWRLDMDCAPAQLDEILAEIDGFLAGVDVVHLSIDLDVLPAAVAPGVSAPAAYGVPLETLLPLCRHLAASGKVAVIDVAELNPTHDIDSRTARVAARLVHTLVAPQRRP
ncbi:formimidoylglutamase [Actinomycetota bacterium]